MAKKSDITPFELLLSGVVFLAVGIYFWNTVQYGGIIVIIGIILLLAGGAGLWRKR